MKKVVGAKTHCSHIINALPDWVASEKSASPASLAFSAGAALALLDQVLKDPACGLPVALLRDRLALRAAVATLKLEGRNESAADIRDAVCLTRAGDSPGPAGEMFLFWRMMSEINLNARDWPDRIQSALPDGMDSFLKDNLETWVQAGSPPETVSEVLVRGLTSFPRQETATLVLADIALARKFGWPAPVPLLAAHLSARDLRSVTTPASDPVSAVHIALVAACDTAVRMASDLTRRATRLREIAPKLRAKGAKEGVDLFLTHDAVSPSGVLSRGRVAVPYVKGVSKPMSDRAARRFCDRLVDLGVVSELTGRSTFRLYGL